MRKLFASTFIISLTIFNQYSFSQNYLGFSNSRFAGVLSAEVNPAAILTEDLRSDWLFPLGFNLGGSNNFATYRKDKALGFKSYLNGEALLKTPKNGRADGNMQIQGPLTFMLRLNKKNALAFSTKVRGYLNIEVNENTLELFDNFSLEQFEGNLFEKYIIGTNAFNTNFSITGMMWLEANLTYSRTIWENKYDNLKFGISTKILNGITGVRGDFEVNDLDVDINSSLISGTVEETLEDFISDINETDLEAFLNDLVDDSMAVIPGTSETIDLTSITSGDLFTLDANFDVNGNLDYSNNLDNFNADFIKNTLNNYWGLGLDIGFVYEFKDKPKDFNKYLRQRIHKPIHSKRHDPPYKWKLGLSLMDIGRIRFDRGQYTVHSNGGKDYSIPYNNGNPLDMLDEIVSDFDAFISSPYGNLDSIKPYNDVIKTSGSYTIGLPTTLNIDWDYHWKKIFYLNVNGLISMSAFKFSDYKLRNVSRLNITPRMETDAFGLFLPLSINYMGQFDLGLGLRKGPLIVGLQNIGTFLYQRNVNRFGIYLGFAKGFAIKSKTDESKSIYFKNELNRYQNK